MKIKFLLTLILCSLTVVCKSQDKKLTKVQIQNDLEFLKKALNEKSSYVYLNRYDFNNDFENYLKTISDTTKFEDFGLFLTEIIGKIGDRHSSVSGYRLTDTLFLPFTYAPEHNRVVALNRNAEKEYEVLNKRFPYLKKVNGIAIEDFLQKILPAEIRAPKEAYFTKSVREIRDIQKNYEVLKQGLSDKIELTFSDLSFQNDTTLLVSPVGRTKRSSYWDEKFERDYLLIKDEDYNKAEIAKHLFKIEGGVGYIKIPSMVAKGDAPELFVQLNSFMKNIRHTGKALIIDVRANGGGTRDLIYELAKYLVHPDSIYIVNATKQRALLPLPEEYKESLHSRNLFAFSELDKNEQNSVRQFLKSFKPQYNLDTQKYSEYYFGLFNGKKLSKGAFYYNKPVYILANEKSFSAASVFVSVFKGIPNIHVVGIKTDGSSGNSERFELPNSKLNVKMSTMVSFQKDGKILDGFGTEPDIKISRDIDQILWKSDTQLEKLKSLILENKQSNK